MKKLLRFIGFLFGGLLAAAAAMVAWGRGRWKRRSRALVARLRAAQTPVDAVFSSSDLAGLPVPVDRYLRAVLPEGRRMIRFAGFFQRGEFLVQPKSGGWAPFRAEQYVATRPCGFVWDARVRMTSGITVHVRDSFLLGKGGMRGSLAGLVPVAAAEGTAEIAKAALQRYLAEAVWYPTALLPACGVAWTPLDDSTARATLESGGVTVEVDFRFGQNGVVEGIFTEARPRIVGGRAIPTPWRGRFSDYAERGGMRIPLAGEVEWVTPEGREPYWRGRITEIEYDP